MNARELLLLGTLLALGAPAGAQQRERSAPALIPFLGVGSWLTRDLAAPGLTRARRYLIGVHGESGQIGRIRIGIYLAAAIRDEDCPDGCTPAGTFFGLGADVPLLRPSSFVRPYFGGGFGLADLGFSYVSPDVRGGIDLGGARRVGLRIEGRYQWILGIGGPDARMVLAGARLRL